MANSKISMPMGRDNKTKSTVKQINKLHLGFLADDFLLDLCFIAGGWLLDVSISFVILDSNMHTGQTLLVTP